MSVTYTLPAINDRLAGVVTAIDSGATNGNLLLMANSAVVSTVQLARPCGVVNGGVLTFSGTLLDPAAAGTGFINEGRVQNGDGTFMITGLSVGAPPGGYDILISNGLNSTLISSGQTVSVLSAQITGS